MVPVVHLFSTQH